MEGKLEQLEVRCWKVLDKLSDKKELDELG